MNTPVPIAVAGPANAGDLGFEADPFADELAGQLAAARQRHQPQAADLYAEYEQPAAAGPADAPPLPVFEEGGAYVAVPVVPLGPPQFRGHAFHRQWYRAADPGAITSPETLATTVLEVVRTGYLLTARNIYIRAVDPTSPQDSAFRTVSLAPDPDDEYGLSLTAPQLAARIMRVLIGAPEGEEGSDAIIGVFTVIGDEFAIGYVPDEAGGSEASTGTRHDFTWYRAVSYKSAEGDCLLAVARAVGTTKPLNAAGKVMRNASVRQLLGIPPGPIAATAANLERLAGAFGVGFTVFGPDPVITRTFEDGDDHNRCRVETAPDVIAYGGAALPKQARVLLQDGHYYHITRDNAPYICPITGDIGKAREPAELRERVLDQGRPWRGANFENAPRKRRSYKPMICVLDFETTWDPQTCKIEPYRAGFIFFEPTEFADGDFRPALQRERVQILTGPNCARDFVTELMSPRLAKFKVKIITFNGARFDNYLLAEAACAKDALSEVFYTGNAIRGLRIGRHSSLDLCKLVQGSLASACASWKTQPAKLDTSRVSELVPFVFTHADIQAARIAGTFDQWMAAHGADLDRYLIYDVLSTASLYMKVLPALSAVTGVEVGEKDTGTVAGASYSGWLAHLERHNIPAPPAPATREEDEFMRAAMTGGRVQVFHPETPYIEADMRMVDVVSLYPTIMSAQNAPLVDAAAPQLLWAQFPTGEPEATDVYRPGFVGIYKVRVVRQDPAKAVLPCKDAGDSLDWRHPGGFDTHATHCDIELIRLAGGEVEVHNGYYWPAARRDLFGSYLAGVMAEKNNQDALKAAGSPDYNPAKREACKLVMNSLSGKVGQRNYEYRAKLVKGAKAQRFVERTQFRDGRVEEWIPLGAERCLLVGKRPLGEAYDPKKAKPSYLSSFIYSYSRAYMWLFVIRGYDVLYMDTDSALLRVAEYERLRAALPELDPERHGGKALGDLEAEDDKVHGMSRAYLLAAKLYAIYSVEARANGAPVRSKARAKGVSDRDLILRDINQLAEVHGRISAGGRPLDPVRAFAVVEGAGDRSGLARFGEASESLFASLLLTGRAVAVSSAMVRVKPAASTADARPNGQAFTMAQRYMIKALVLPRSAGGAYKGLNWARHGDDVEPEWETHGDAAE